MHGTDRKPETLSFSFYFCHLSNRREKTTSNRVILFEVTILRRTESYKVVERSKCIFLWEPVWYYGKRKLCSRSLHWLVCLCIHENSYDHKCYVDKAVTYGANDKQHLWYYNTLDYGRFWRCYHGTNLLSRYFITICLRFFSDFVAVEPFWL